MYVRIVNDVNLLQLQHALDSLLRWAEEWQLSISTDKILCPKYWTVSIIARAYDASRGAAKRK